MVELRRSTRTTTAKSTADSTSKVTKPKSTKGKPKPSKEPKAPAQEKPKLETSIPETKSEIDVGDTIPDITLMNQDNSPVSLKDLSKTNKIILIFAYPKASTPGCTRQACGFRDNYNSIKDKAYVLGLSADSPKAQKNFQSKQGLQYELLSDPKRDLIGKLGAKKSPTGIKRSHWIFVDGKLKDKRVGISPEVSFKEGKEKVLEYSK